MKREKIFNLPGVVTALIAILTIIQIAVDLFPRSVGVWTLVYFSFIPARLSFLVAPNQVLHALADVDATNWRTFSIRRDSPGGRRSVTPFYMPTGPISRSMA